MGYDGSVDATPVRRGGKWTPVGFRFELTGGDVSLDLVNTVDMRPLESRKELLGTYEDVCSWARQVALITAGQESDLIREATRHPAKARAARLEFVEARECLFQILLALTKGQKISEALRQRWNDLVHRALAHHEVVQDGGVLAWRNAADPRDFDFMLWPVIQSAATLLSSPQARRIRRCAAETCDWMFLDTSKRGNRRWCDMTVCGNRAKARRFYLRSKAPKETP